MCEHLFYLSSGCNKEHCILCGFSDHECTVTHAQVLAEYLGVGYRDDDDDDVCNVVARYCQAVIADTIPAIVDTIEEIGVCILTWGKIPTYRSLLPEGELLWELEIQVAAPLDEVIWETVEEVLWSHNIILDDDPGDGTVVVARLKEETDA